MKLIGHRGLMLECPQNTIPSFELAIRRGVYMIEFDVQIAKTNEVVVFHDDDLYRITKGQSSESINNLTFDELRKLNVHDGFNNNNDNDIFYQIPTLEEVLDLVNKLDIELGKKTTINIELKSAYSADPVAKILGKYSSENIIISSFRQNELEIFKQLKPNIDIGVILGNEEWKSLNEDSKEAINLAKKLNGVSLNVSINFVNTELVQAAHENNLEILVWTIKNQSDYYRIKDLGIDGIFTNTMNIDFGF